MLPVLLKMATEWTRTNSFEHLLIHRVFVLNSIYYQINYIDLTNFYHLFVTSQRDLFFLVTASASAAATSYNCYCQKYSLFYPFARCHNHLLRCSVRYWTCTNACSCFSPSKRNLDHGWGMHWLIITQEWHSKLIV